VIMSVMVLVVSSALFFFYVQAFCEKALRREFSHPYFQDIITSIRLEYPRLRDTFAANASFNYSDACLTLKCDFMTLEYLLKNSDPSRRHLSGRERLLVLYFRFLLLCLPIRHAFKLQEKQAVLGLAAFLQFFANSVGEKLSVNSTLTAASGLES
jgi:hypothetical protein